MLSYRERQGAGSELTKESASVSSEPPAGASDALLANESTPPVDATAVVAECPDATGREIPPTELPYVNPSSAGMGVIAGETRMPPDSILCWMAAFLLNIVKKS